MQDSLDEVTQCIEWYSENKNASPHKLVEILRVISTNVFFLETYRANFKHSYESMVFNEVNEGSSVARAVNKAEVELPELYMLRHIIDSSYRVCDAIRTQVSLMKSEKTNVNVQT